MIDRNNVGSDCKDVEIDRNDGDVFIYGLRANDIVTKLKMNSYSSFTISTPQEQKVQFCRINIKLISFNALFCMV